MTPDHPHPSLFHAQATFRSRPRLRRLRPDTMVRDLRMPWTAFIHFNGCVPETQMRASVRGRVIALFSPVNIPFLHGGLLLSTLKDSLILQDVVEHVVSKCRGVIHPHYDRILRSDTTALSTAQLAINLTSSSKDRPGLSLFSTGQGDARTYKYLSWLHWCALLECLGCFRCAPSDHGSFYLKPHCVYLVLRTPCSAFSPAFSGGDLKCGTYYRYRHWL